MRDISKVNTDLDIVRENHRFSWNEDDVDSWGKQLVKHHYDKQFKGCCIVDLSRHKENKVTHCSRMEEFNENLFMCTSKLTRIFRTGL